MKTAMITVKTDPKVKKEMQKFSEHIGVSLSALTNAFYKKTIREGRVEFVASERMTPKLEQSLAAIEKDIRAGKNLVGPFSTVEELRLSLES